MHGRHGKAMVAALGVTALALVASAAASPRAKLLDLFKATPTATTAAPLRAGATYQASLFPLPVRLSAVGGPWLGDQYRTTERGAPRFGWAQVGHPGVKGLITIVSAYGRTPSVGAVIARLRLGGSHEPDSNV